MTAYLPTIVIVIHADDHFASIFVSNGFSLCSPTAYLFVVITVFFNYIIFNLISNFLNYNGECLTFVDGIA